MNDLRFSSREPGHLLGAKFRASLLCVLALAGVGCNQSADTPTAPQSDAKVVGQPPESAKPLGAADNPFPELEVKYEDISDSAASAVSPMTILGEGPQRHMDPHTLNSLRNSFLSRGNPMRAKKVENSYDLKTGDYKGNAEALQTGAPLAKAETWVPSDVTFRVGFKTTWTSDIPNGSWGGASSSNSDTLAFPRIYGFNPRTLVQNGTTPSLYFKVKWRGSANWTANRSWNEAHSTVGGNPGQWMQAFSATTSYVTYNICYTAFVVFQNPNNGNHYNYYPQEGCNGNDENGNPGGVGMSGYSNLWFTGIKFEVISH
jgi:hypothetical protein